METNKHDLYDVSMKIKEEDFPESGVFITKIRIVNARKVIKNEERFIDKTGEEHIGILGDWKCTDEDGNNFFMDRHSFKYKYVPFDSNAFKIIEGEGYKISQLLDKILSGVEDE